MESLKGRTNFSNYLRPLKIATPNYCMPDWAERWKRINFNFPFPWMGFFPVYGCQCVFPRIWVLTSFPIISVYGSIYPECVQLFYQVYGCQCFFFPVVKWVLIFFLLLGSMGVFIQNECQFFSKYMGANVYFSVGIWEIILFPSTWVY